MQLLGPPRVWAQGREVPVATRKGMALLAYVLDRAGTPCPRGQLADMLWALPESEARHNLRQELYRLRRTPPGTWLRVDPTHVTLAVPVATDVADLTAAAAREDWAAAAALGGTFLDGLEVDTPAWEEWVSVRRAALRLTWQRAAERDAQDLVARGDRRAALARYRALLAGDELQERLHHTVMTLHAQLGEREAALAQFARCRDVLWRELRLEPLPDTHALAEAIRSPGRLEPVTAPADAGAAAAVGPLIPAVVPLVGREREWARVLGAPGLVLIEGDSGVGKSRLALEVAQACGPALHVRAQRAQRRTPLHAAATLLRAALGLPGGEARVAALPEVWRREGARLVPEVDAGAVILDPPTPDGRARFVEGMLRVLEALLPQGVTVVVDDIQWLDVPSAEVFALLAPRVTGRVLLTLRRGEEDSDAARQMVSDLARDVPVERVELRPLDVTDVQELVWVLSGSDAPLFAGRLHRATGGNALAVVETLRHLAGRGDLRVDAGGQWHTAVDGHTHDYEDLPLPDSVRAAILERASALGGPARRVLDAASLATEPFALVDVRAATNLPEWEAAVALDRAVAAGLLSVGEEGGGYRFSHEQVRAALASEIGPERRRLLHRALADAGAAGGAAPAEVAWHLERAGQRRDAAPYRVRAAEAAAAVYAHDQALGHYRHALADDVDAATAYAVHVAMTPHLRALDLGAERRASLDAQDVLAGQLDLGVDERVRHAVRWAVYHTEQDDEACALAVVQAALTQLRGVSPGQLAPLWLEGGAALCGLGRHDEAETWLLRVLNTPQDRAPESGAGAWYWLAACAHARDDTAAADERLRAALAGFRHAGHGRGVAMTLWRQGTYAALAGDVDGSALALAGAVEVARDIGNVDLHRVILRDLVTHLTRAGRSAVPWADEGLRLARTMGDADLEATCLAATAP